MEQQQARETIRTMSSFLENSSAALRGILNGSFFQMARLMEEEGRGEEEKRCLASMRRDLYRLLRLSWNLNDLSRIGIDEPLKKGAVSGSLLAKSLFDEAEPLLRGLGLAMRLRAEETPLLAINGHYTRRILYQLLANAAAVSPQGGTVTLSCRYTGKRMIFSVADEGGGIPPEKIASVFQTPLSPETEFSPHGLRIGLPLAKGLAEAQGGDLIVENTASGARFTLTIPAVSTARKELNEARVDLTGGVQQGLVELSDVLRVEAYLPEEDDWK